MTDKVEIAAKFGMVDGSKVWEEKLMIPADAEPNQYCEQLVKEYNNEEIRRHEQEPAYIVRIRRFI